MKKYFRIIVIAIILIVLGFLAFYDNGKMIKDLNSLSKGYAVKIDDELVSVGEFETYLYEQKKEFEQKGGEDIWETDFDGVSAQEVAKQNAINSLVLVKTAVNQAPELGISLNDEERKSIKDKGKQYQDKMKEECPKIELSLSDAEKIVEEGLIQSKVYDFVTKGFEMSDADFESYFNEYYELNKKELNDVKISYIFKGISADEENSEAVINEANSLYERVLMGEDFKKLQAENSALELVLSADVKALNLGSELEEVVYSLKQGEISDVIFTELGFYIIKAESVVTADMGKLREEILQNYELAKKQEIYQNQLGKWAEKVVIEKNEKICNEININEI